MMTLQEANNIISGVKRYWTGRSSYKNQRLMKTKMVAFSKKSDHWEKNREEPFFFSEEKAILSQIL